MSSANCDEQSSRKRKASEESAEESVEESVEESAEEAQKAKRQKIESEVSTAAKLTSQNKAPEELDGTSEELDATSKEDHNSSNSSVLDALTGHCDEEDDSETISEDNK